MEKKLKRIGIDSSYLNKIAEGSISLKPSDEYFIEDDVLTEFIVPFMVKTFAFQAKKTSVLGKGKEARY